MSISGNGDDPLHLSAAADASARVLGHVGAVARAAAETSEAARHAEATAAELAGRVKHHTATTVAAAAADTAQIAARAASEVRAEAVKRALEVAASALSAIQAIADLLPADLDPRDLQRVADSFAAGVAADIVAQTRSTEDAAARVADAVTLAAEAGAHAAASAAARVDAAATAAGAAADVVADLSETTQDASSVAVGSSAHAAELASGRLAVIRQAPLVAELENAVERDELKLHYQPIYAMDTGGVVAVEALIRWEHPTRGLLFPAQFLDVAEGPLLVTPVGDWIIATAVAQAADWQRCLGVLAPRMWVNVSCEQLGRHHMVQVVEDLLSTNRLAPGALGIEITERQLLRRVDAVATDLLALHELGVALAVDDFGTGYASLDYLRRFSFDEIKIDRSFVSGLDQDRTDTAVTSSIIALGRSLDLAVVGEGVETPDQYDCLKRLGCSAVQGYLFQRPASADTISEILTRKRDGERRGRPRSATPREPGR